MLFLVKKLLERLLKCSRRKVFDVCDYNCMVK